MPGKRNADTGIVRQQRRTQAMVPPTGMGDADRPMPMKERMARRFPQPVRVGDLIGLPVVDDSDSTLGFVRRVVRTPENRIELIIAYGGWFGWGARPVATIDIKSTR